MTVKIGLSGFGRIGRLAMRASMDMPDVDIVGINKRNANLEYMAYMLKYDTVFGRFPGEVGTYEGGLTINGRKIPVSGENEIKDIDWVALGVDYVIECTGAFLTTEACLPHITEGGAKKVIISAPAKDDTPMFVVGVNSDKYDPAMQVVSNASCTTNCLAPVAKVLNDKYGIEMGLMSTIHASTSKQAAVDKSSEKDWRIGRSVYGNIIPSTTGAAKAVGKVIPELQGKLTGVSYRIPSADGSVVDLNVVLKTPTTYEDVCATLKEASEGYMKGVLAYSEEALTSVDILGETHTSIVDAKMGLGLTDTCFKVVSWYDNEFGYARKTLELAAIMDAKDKE